MGDNAACRIPCMESQINTPHMKVYYTVTK